MSANPKSPSFNPAVSPATAQSALSSNRSFLTLFLHCLTAHSLLNTAQLVSARATLLKLLSSRTAARPIAFPQASFLRLIYFCFLSPRLKKMEAHFTPAPLSPKFHQWPSHAISASVMYLIWQVDLFPTSSVTP